MVERSLDISIRMMDDWFEVDVLDPESGCGRSFDFPYSADEHPTFIETIGEELYSWISLWKDAMEGAS